MGLKRPHDNVLAYQDYAEMPIDFIHMVSVIQLLPLRDLKKCKVLGLTPNSLPHVVQASFKGVTSCLNLSGEINRDNTDRE